MASRTRLQADHAGPQPRLLPSAHAIEREYRVMDALALSGVPVARMHLLCQDESVIGRAFYWMGFVKGRVLWESGSQEFLTPSPQCHPPCGSEVGGSTSWLARLHVLAHRARDVPRHRRAGPVDPGHPERGRVHDPLR